MESNLRPLSLGEILDRTAQLYRENFVLFAGIAAVYAGAMLVLNLLQIGIAELLRVLQMTRYVQLASLAFVVLILPLVFIFSGAAMAANNRAVAWVNLGQPATIRGAYLSILPRLGRYLWIMTIATFFIYLPFVLIYGAFFVLIFSFVGLKGASAHSGAAADPYAGAIVGIASILILLLSFPAIVYAIWMALRYSLAIPASVVEDLKARPALRRSVELSQGARGRILLLGLLIAVIQIGLVLVTQSFFIAMAFKHKMVLPAWAQAAQQIVGFLTNSFIGPMYATGLTLFYYDQRVRKEGFDIEWMMQAAGLTVPAPAPESAAPQTAPVEQAAPVANIEPAPPAEPTQPSAPQNPGTAHE